MPDDNNTIPLISTIRETTLAAIAKKYNIEKAQKRFDISHSQSDSGYITGEIDEYNDTIQDIIDNIPDVPPTPPGPTLPTVTLYRKSVQYTGYQINTGDSQFLVDSGTKISYDASVTYGFRQWLKFTTTEHSPGQIINDSGYVAAKNTGSSAVSGVYMVDYATCSDATSVVVTVYNVSNVAYDAFKFTLEGTDYYWVLDETQADWTDDLSSIGYSLTPVGVDVATGTMANIILPTDHSGYYTDVTFESLRYYAKGELSDTGVDQRALFGYSGPWYYGTISWTDTSLGDLTDKLAVNSNFSGILFRQTIFRIIFICDGSISGYHPYDTQDASGSESSQITAYSYNNGIHRITFYSGIDWTNGTYSGRIQFRYLDGTTTFKGLDPFDLVVLQNGSLYKVSTSYNPSARASMYNEWNGNITVSARYSLS